MATALDEFSGIWILFYVDFFEMDVFALEIVLGLHAERAVVFAVDSEH